MYEKLSLLKFFGRESILNIKFERDEEKNYRVNYEVDEESLTEKHKIFIKNYNVTSLSKNIR